MADHDRCPHCGADIPEASPRGVCPRCLMKAGLYEKNEVTADVAVSIEGPGTTIGHYELLELIGEGGMGLVYLAEQHDPIQRRVALKIVKLGMDTMQVVARFRAEQQTLARLDHPNIAKVFDAGTTESGRPYFVMEYVEGSSITKYCDDRKLSIEERLRLFKEVCEGVHHAHQKGIIHRDIKPSNVLVSTQEEKHVPKIIDFGVAKALTEPLADATSFTRDGQLLGTPEYMSPEQVDLAIADIDTRSDIYSLGVLLYELLAGVLPFDRELFRKAGLAEIQQTLQEEPTSPSTRLTSLGEEAKAIAERRQTQLLTLARRLHRELEWIPMKAMRKDRTRRYRSASELADDIQNYLTGTPLIAGPESNVYRARKFVRKHAGSVTSAALVAVVIVLGLIISTAFSFKAEKARGEEAAARAQAEEAREQAEQARDKETALRQQVEQALARAEKAEAIAEERNEEYRRVLYVHSIQLADARYRSGKVNVARKLLESCPEDLRGWEWDRVNHVLDHSLMSFSPHVGQMWASALSPDGKRMVCGGTNRTIQVVDLATGKELTSIAEAHTGDIRRVAFSPDGERIASCDRSGEVKVWDIADTNQPLTSIRHAGNINCVAFSSDGDQILSVSPIYGTIKVWDASTGTERLVLSRDGAARGSVFFAAFSPNGRDIVSVGRDGIITIWDAVSGDEKMSLEGHEDVIETVSYNSEGSLFATGSEDNTIKIWNATTGSLLETLYGHEGMINAVAFSPDDKTIISGSWDSTVRIWDIATGEELRNLRGHKWNVYSVAFTPDGKRAVSGSEDGTIKIWDVNVDREIKRFLGHGNQVRSIAFSPDGERLVSRSLDGNIKVWDAISGGEIMTLSEEVSTLEPPYAFYCQVSLSPDGKQIALNPPVRGIVIRDAETGHEITTLGNQEDDVSSLAFSPDGKRIVSGSSDGKLKLWEVETGEEIRTLSEGESEISSVAFSPDGKQIVSGYRSGEVKVWDAANGTEPMSLIGHARVFQVTFSPDGKRIASAGVWMARIWDAAIGKELKTLRGHGDFILSIAFSPDGRRLVTGSRDGTAKIWDSSSGDELLTLHTDSPVPDVAFSPDGTSIAGGTMGKTIVLWESAAP